MSAEMVGESQADPAAVVERLKDGRYWCETTLFIVDQDRQRVPFIWNGPQAEFWERRSLFDMILKSRKVGFSTQIEGCFLHRCATSENERAVVISHEEKATKKLFGKVRYMQQNSVLPINVTKNSEEELYFPDTNSTFYIGTAGSKSFARGDDITLLHFSELAFYENMAVVTGALEACVDNAWRVIESTANGAGNYHHQLWLKSMSGENDWRWHFIPWWQDPRCIRPVKVVLVLDETERQLRQAFNLPDERLEWRRWKLRTMPEPDKFPQEYPSTWEEAFISAGKMMFDWRALKEMEDGAERPKWVGHLVNRGQELGMEIDPKGPLTIWQNPR